MRQGLGPAILRWLRSEEMLLLAGVGGLLLRLYQITSQIVADDEWHALWALHVWSYARIVSHFGVADYSIPLTLLYKALATTVGLTEMVMRAPMLICGVAAIVVLPLMVRQYVGRAASHVFAWLLAIAPLHVYFSRYARPYSITMLLAVVAVVAFFEWTAGGSRQWAWIYAVAAIAAPYFHLAVLPFVLAPLLFGLGEWVLRSAGGRTRSLREILKVGLVVGTGLAVLLIVPLAVDSQSLTKKIGTSTIRWATVKGAAQLLTGTAHLWLVGTMAVLVVIGWVWLSRRQKRLAVYVAFLTACQIAALVVTRPDVLEASIVLVRYLLPLLPLLLLCAAVGIVVLRAAIARAFSVWPARVLAPVVTALLLVFGPLPAIYYYPNNWTNHALFQYEYDPSSPYAYTRTWRPRRIPPFYERLAAFPAGTLLIVEAPWYYQWSWNPYPYYQAVHRQRMQVGFMAATDRFTQAGELPSTSTVRFQNAVHVGDATKLRWRKVRYVIFHKSLHEEIPASQGGIVDISEWVRRYGLTYGAPVYQDVDLVVFDVACLPPRREC